MMNTYMILMGTQRGVFATTCTTETEGLQKAHLIFVRTAHGCIVPLALVLPEQDGTAEGEVEEVTCGGCEEPCIAEYATRTPHALTTARTTLLQKAEGALRHRDDLLGALARAEGGTQRPRMAHGQNRTLELPQRPHGTH